MISHSLHSREIRTCCGTQRELDQLCKDSRCPFRSSMSTTDVVYYSVSAHRSSSFTEHVSSALPDRLLFCETVSQWHLDAPQYPPLSGPALGCRELPLGHRGRRARLPRVHTCGDRHPRCKTDADAGRWPRHPPGRLQTQGALWQQRADRRRSRSRSEEEPTLTAASSHNMTGTAFNSTPAQLPRSPKLKVSV